LFEATSNLAKGKVIHVTWTPTCNCGNTAQSRMVFVNLDAAFRLMVLIVIG
jgi:hypothetical protein